MGGGNIKTRKVRKLKGEFKAVREKHSEWREGKNNQSREKTGTKKQRSWKAEIETKIVCRQKRS